MLPLQVMSCLDDDNQSTRLVSCKVLRMILLHKPRCVDGKLTRHSRHSVHLR